MPCNGNIPSYHRTQMLTKCVWVLPMPQNHNIDVFGTNPSKWKKGQMNHVNWWLKFSMFSDILIYCFSYNLYLKGGGARAEVI